MTAAIDDMVRAIDGTVGAMLAGAVRTGVDGHPNQHARRVLKNLDEALRARAGSDGTSTKTRTGTPTDTATRILMGKRRAVGRL